MSSSTNRNTIGGVANSESASGVAPRSVRTTPNYYRNQLTPSGAYGDTTSSSTAGAGRIPASVQQLAQQRPACQSTSGHASRTISSDLTAADRNRTSPRLSRRHQEISLQPSNLAGQSAAYNDNASVDRVSEPSSAIMGQEGHFSPMQPPAANSRPSLNRFENNEALPDILHSHLLPPYTTPRPNQHRPSRQAGHRPRSQGRAHSIDSNRNRGQMVSAQTRLDEDEDEKTCCNKMCCINCLSVMTTFRWVLVTLALLGVCCVITGIILGALHMTVGSSFLTLSLMFIGLGVMLVVVVGVGWKCTPRGHEPCHLLFSLGDHYVNEGSRRHRSHGRSRDRNNWFGGLLYPEFRYRRPPPSYNASMQEYQQQIMMAHMQGAAGQHLPNSPPPTYRSQASTIRPGIHITFPVALGDDYPSSRPPTYRSHIGRDGEPTRPSLPMDSDGGIVNPACLDELHVDIPAEGASSPPSLPSTAASTPACSSPTLNRAIQVMRYLEGVLEDQMQKLSQGTDSQTEGLEQGSSSSDSNDSTEEVTEQCASSSDCVADTPL